jgi:hypothetical protein
MKRKLVCAAILIAVVFGAFNASAINEYMVMDHETGKWWVNHTWYVDGDPPTQHVVDYSVTVNGANHIQTERYYNHTDMGNAQWSNITVLARGMGGTPICTGNENVFLGYSAEPVPFPLWALIIAFGIIMSVIACIYNKNVVISVPLGAIGVIAFIFGGNVVTTNGVVFHSGGVVVSTVTDVLISQIVMLFAIFPLLIAIVSIIATVYVTLADKKERQLSEFDDQWG